MRRLFFGFTLAVLAVFPVLCQKTADDESRNTKKRQEFFGSGYEALAWDSDELQKVRDLLKRNFKEKGRYMKAKNLADYLGLSRVDALHVPVPVNVLMLGFTGDGQLSVNITSEEMKEWFEHIDHVIPHTRVPLSELSCQEDGSCTRLGQVRRPSPLHSYVHLNISAHAVEVSPEVMLRFEKAAEAFARPAFAAYPTGPRVVDATSMEHFIEGFLNDLGLLWSYTVVVLNPGRTPFGESYSYKSGLLKHEIDLLTRDPKLIWKLEKAATSLPAKQVDPPHFTPFIRSWLPTRPVTKFSVNSLIQESSQWCNHVDDWFKIREKVVKPAKEKMTESSVLGNMMGIQGFHKDASLVDLLRVMGKSHEDRDKDIGTGRLRVMEPEEGCDVDTWVGHERWIMFDLTVMGRDWGPYVGGDGIKTSHSLPLVLQHFPRANQGLGRENKEVEDRLFALLDDEIDKMAHRVQREHEDSERRRSAEKKQAGDNATTFFKMSQEVPDETWIRAELDVYEAFAHSHCHGRKEPPEICSELEDRVDELLKEAASGNVDASTISRAHAWDIFGQSEVLTEEIASHASRSKDLFLAHLSAVISKSVRHVFLPPSIAWEQQPGASSDMGLPFRKSVTFILYMVSDPARKAHDHHHHTEFDLEGFKSEVMKLKTKSQVFRFTIKQMSLMEDPGLSGAISMSVRSTNRENLNRKDNLSDELLYFDSAELGLLLRRRLMQPGGERHNKIGHDPTNLQIPVFILSLDREAPIYIDQHYVAKALPDMIVIAHNCQARGQHPMGITCNGDLMGQTVGASLKAALSATLQHLGGLLPPHLGFSPTHGVVTHDWMWSVGAHPFSMTSPGWKVTQAQADAVKRRYVLDALDSSIDIVNDAIKMLEGEKITEGSYDRLYRDRGYAMNILKEFSLSVELWRRTVNNLGEMEFDGACSKISELERSAESIMQNANALRLSLHPEDCGKIVPKPRFGVPDEVLGVVLLGVIGIAVYIMMPKKKKRKLF